MTKFRFVVLKCQDCAFFEPSHRESDHSGTCLRSRSWAEPFSRTCSHFVTLDKHLEKIVPHVKVIRLTKRQLFDQLGRED